ncbi:HAMP domain-containing protein [Candidatus Sulfidibacterium hydrothermale]|uniref:sensor histidine kinase n=1 Tax=Candidatus Sulfidibacterium hydrothermale TaxID=2875962 RepID=UPI001F0AF39D|nr:ATP-binding protein [Candidatus Sulfidibacterium hydrothermale]UBM63092.1 HAMP domain-containing protein [Candidatus Sulfidibacterium hydrothermale]
MKAGFKERLAFLYLISTAGIISILFVVITFKVKKSVFQHLDHDIYIEAVKHSNDIYIHKGKLRFNRSAWLEREHQMVQVNPVFVEAVDSNGEVIARSPNLKEDSLRFLPEYVGKYRNTTLANGPVRQYQYAIRKNGKTYGYLLVAMSLDSAQMVLKKLKTTLLIAFPVVLIILFFWARFIAGKSIRPVMAIIETSDKITRTNLHQRVPLPGNKDELYLLSTTINRLLDRIEQAMEREKQFTSDAAHELKTPLQVMKGNMEILIRKPRNPEEYQSKIKSCLHEINRMAHLVDQLLLLARFESQREALDIREVPLDELVEQVIQKKLWQIEEKKINLKVDIQELVTVKSDPYLLHIIFENVLSNAIKYTPEKGTVTVNMGKENHKPFLSIQDSGPGIKPEDLDKIFDRFYRSDPLKHPHIKGTGLGLSIVKRLSEILHLEFVLKSNPGEGLLVYIAFPEKEPVEA